MSRETMQMAKIYVADLAAYNAGVLHGVWIDLEGKTVNEVEDEIHVMMREGQRLYVPRTLSPHEEWAIHDYEGFGDIRISEHEDLGTLLDLSEAIEKHGDPFVAWISEAVGDIGYFADVADAVSQFEDCFVGPMTLEDYAYEYASEVLGLKDTALDYFNYEKFANDLSMSGDMTEVYYNGVDYVFRAW
ncbi:anti-restriction protein [Mycobacterium phage Benedict]|uniref:ArdA-like antirestriction protein n=1 Tax=Mycobacterium phage Benedict TaxID=2902890 RepID=G1EDN0_9CAUD|nr:anti-restriction protein [Mycobacterium phage Benedict]AEJ93434.1 ArdA-like antirestriction protein [Mycobacterium phage Benedict]